MILNVELTSTLALLMHNERLANPLDPAAKKLKVMTAKRKKTEDDLMVLSRVEWEGGLYYDDSLGPYIPQKWILSMIRDSARITKQGKDATRAIVVHENDIPLEFEGPRDLEGMWSAGFFDRRMVGNQKARVLRTRPRFNKWSLKFNMEFDDAIFDRPQVERILVTAGRLIGLGDYRPVYGRFESKVTA